jgi:hypothetical protein
MIWVHFRAPQKYPSSGKEMVTFNVTMVDLLPQEKFLGQGKINVVFEFSFTQSIS